MKSYRTLPFHVFQDSCNRRDFRYMGISGRFFVTCMRGPDRCSHNICPIWNNPNILSNSRSNAHDLSVASESEPDAVSYEEPEKTVNVPVIDQPIIPLSELNSKLNSRKLSDVDKVKEEVTENN